MRRAVSTKPKDEADSDTHRVAARRLRRVLGQSIANWSAKRIVEELARHPNRLESPFGEYDTQALARRMQRDFRSLQVEDLDGDWGEESGKWWAFERARLSDLLKLACDPQNHTWESLLNEYGSVRASYDGLDVLDEHGITGPRKRGERRWVKAFIAGALAVTYEVLPRLIRAGEAA